MANQPKKYTKFVATAATATLVASAIVPVASASFTDVAETNSHAANINALVEAKIIGGYADGTFKPNQQLTRGQVVKMLGKWVEAQGVAIPTDYATVARFTDVAVDAKDQELVKYAALVADTKVFAGSNGALNAAGTITRENMALVLDRAYAAINGTSLVAAAADAEVKTVSDLATAKAEAREAIQALRNLGISGVDTFSPKAAVTRGQFASFLNKTINVEAPKAAELTLTSAVATSATTLAVVLSDESKHVVTLPTALEANKATEVKFTIGEKEYTSTVTFVVAPLTVNTVTATNATTLAIAGVSLTDLTATDITVENNTVKSVTVAEDGKSATVVLDNSLNVDVATKVTSNGKDFSVTYTVVAENVSIKDGVTYDDNTADQYVLINIGGKEVTASELRTAGYDVKFEAFSNKAATATVGLFASGTDSKTGELAADLVTPLVVPTEGTDVYVKVTVTKGSEVLTSPLAKIKVINKDLAANNIVGAKLVNVTDVAKPVEQLSSTLKTNETAVFAEIGVKSGSKVDYYTTGFVVKSSDESIVSVNKTDNKLTAQGPGTATVTITFGGASYTETITVKNEKREAASVKVEKTSVAVLEGATNTVKVQLLDQYGDPMDFVGTSGITPELVAVSSDETVATAVISNPTGTKNEALVTITGVDTGSALFTFRDESGAKLGTTSVTVNVTENGAIAQYSLAVDTDITSTDLTNINAAVGSGVALVKEQISTDATIDVNDDSYVKLRLKGLNSAGQEIVDEPAVGTYTVTTNVSAAGVLATTPTFDAAGFIVVEAGTKAGTATITVTNNADGKVIKTFKVTVTDIGNNVIGATIKNVAAPTYATTLDYEDFLSYTEAGAGFDPIIKDLKLSKPATQPIRLDLTTADLYIDKNGNGDLDANEIVVGSLAFGQTGTIAASTIGAAVTTGVAVTTADDGLVIFKVLNSEGEVVASKAVTINF